MALKDFLKNKTASEKAVIKAQALANCQIPLTFTHKGITVNLSTQPRERRGLLEVYIDSAFQGSKRLFINDPFLYKNPPILVSDGIHHKEVKTTPGGTKFEADVPNYVENLEQALKEIIVETIRVLNK